MAKAYYLVVSVIAGAAVLALEVLAVRATAPALGSGSATWAALLATALATLAAGNLLGGFWSERAGGNAAIVWPLAIAAADLVVFSQVHGLVLRWAAEGPLLLGVSIAAAATQAVPLAMLGIMTPIILKSGRNHSGRWAGIVLAAGCGGGIAGALATGLLLLPGVGLTRSYLCVGLLLAGTALPGVWAERRWASGLLLVISLALAAWCWGRPRDGVVESLYGQLEVRDSALTRLLLIDGLPQTAMPEGLTPGEALRQGYLLEIALTMRPGTQTALVVGLGAGLAPRILGMYGLSCESIEIDPAVVEIARSRFGFKGSVIVGDGRAVLSRDDRSFDLIFLDICTTDRIAWHLLTVEAMHLMRDRLTPDGVLAIQFIGDDGSWSASVVQTVAAAFGRERCLLLAPAPSVRPVGLRWVFAVREGSPALDHESASGTHPAWRQLAAHGHVHRPVVPPDPEPGLALGEHVALPLHAADQGRGPAPFLSRDLPIDGRRLRHRRQCHLRGRELHGLEPMGHNAAEPDQPNDNAQTTRHGFPPTYHWAHTAGARLCLCRGGLSTGSGPLACRAPIR